MDIPERLYKSLLAIGMAAILLSSASGNADKAMSLMECYEAALKHGETIAISQEEIAKASARFMKSIGGNIPRISMRATEFLQDQVPNSGGSTFSNSFTRFSKPEVAITAYQPLFQGLREYVSIKLSGSDKALQQYNLENVKRLLFMDVATAFYTVINVQQSIHTTKEMIAIMRGRVADLSERVEIGKSRISEQVGQQTELALLEADLEESFSNLQNAREMFSFLTGLSPDTPINPSDSSPASSSRQLSSYLTNVANRPDVKAAEERSKLSKGAITVARSYLLPKIDVTANYYPYRIDFQKDIKWDALFKLEIPLFDLAKISDVKEAKAGSIQADLELQLAKRTAENEVTLAHNDWIASYKRLAKYQSAATLAKSNYSYQLSDYELGLINHLDLLQAERTWLDALRKRDEATIEERLNWIGLQVLSGGFL